MASKENLVDESQAPQKLERAGTRDFCGIFGIRRRGVYGYAGGAGEGDAARSAAGFGADR